MHALHSALTAALIIDSEHDMTEKKRKKLSKKRQTSSKSILDSANQIWLAGLGAFSKAQEEGGKLFEGLVNEGLELESTTRKVTTAKVNVVRGAVEGTVGQVQAKASNSWDKLEKVFEDRVARALGVLGVPTAKDINKLTRRVEELQAAVNAFKKAEPKPVASKKKAAKKTTAKPAVKAVKAVKAEKAEKVSKKTATRKKVLRKKTASKKTSS
jgi:poly(hydroxyalkanoate) granule-associated protein